MLNNNVCIASYNGLRANDEGFDRGSADFVYGGAYGRLGKTCTNGALPGWILAEARGEG